MSVEFERKHHTALAHLIETVLRHRGAPLHVSDLATSLGFSRYHLSRLYKGVTGETLEGFMRRIRLERSAFHLLHSHRPIGEIATDCGYESADAFCRAFKTAFAVSPRTFRKLSGTGWKLYSPVDLHWNEHWGSEDPDALPGKVECGIHYRSAYEAAVWRWTGNYGQLAEGWKQLETKLGSLRQGLFITIYRDNMWTHPSSKTMRADLGWVLTRGNEPIPTCMKRIVIPGGLYVTTERYVDRSERNDAWSYVCAKWPSHGLSYDLYPAWPLPFENVKTRIVIQLHP